MDQRILVLKTGGFILPAWQTKEDHSVEDIEGYFSQHDGSEDHSVEDRRVNSPSMMGQRTIVLKTGGLFLPV